MGCTVHTKDPCGSITVSGPYMLEGMLSLCGIVHPPAHSRCCFPQAFHVGHVQMYTCPFLWWSRCLYFISQRICWGHCSFFWRSRTHHG